MPLWFAGLLKTEEWGKYLPILSIQNYNKNLPRMLGYSYGQHTSQSQFGSVSSTFGMDNVQCTGNETSLLDCPHLTVDDCGTHEGAGVICSNTGMLQALRRHHWTVFREYDGIYIFDLFAMMKNLIFCRFRLNFFWLLQLEIFTSTFCVCFNWSLILLQIASKVSMGESTVSKVSTVAWSWIENIECVKGYQTCQKIKNGQNCLKSQNAKERNL